ncbi:2-succinyl-6-hydroxy-2,4-cyclohexadiene-1-carboxylate synthase [Siccirubricoccus deserti]|uniref:Alpha/beta hydrolase n=1 Tax=Siccirubricoccus deserti TaxID=2013562 RepID=A0A9X0R3Z4_9PROT|nr:alpha/beta hydrolase [Siccirubricoccus deserti]MBC4019201.1 alpha/beta hydrolase [Siccirubricoccus deserti]GGC71873.1 2-succinyl-6-hydroxy-2,4-cyclohexadiene-1-carboxylate synthase [Siccirubricoccus deserti]
MRFTAPAQQTGWIERPDCRIAYQKVGAGPPLVFAHGLGGCFMSWWQQVAHFAPRYNCISFSHRGFWPSSAPPEGPDPAAYAADLAALVDQLDLGDIRLVCQSMGGWTGVEYALLRPGRVKALVLAATTGTLDPQQMRQLERDRLAAWAAESATTRADLGQRRIHPAAGATMAEAQPALHLLYGQLDALSAGLDKEAVRARLGASRTRPPAALAAAGCPVLFVPGGRDIVIPPFAARAMAAELPDAWVAPIPAAGHSGYFEHAAAFNALVEAFLDGIE